VGWKVTLSTTRKSSSHHDVERALLETLDEVRRRIENDVQLY